MCVLVFCVCSSYCVSKSVCARVFAFMSVYEGLYVFEWVPARLVKTDSLVVSFVFSLYWCLCPWQKSARTHTCLWRGCWRTLLGMCLFFSMLSLCEFACVYVHRCMWHICLLSLCLCECVHTCVCVARMLGTFLRRWEKRGFQCSRLLFHSSSIASLLLAPHAILQTQTQTQTYTLYTYVKTSTHTQTQTSRFTCYVLTHTQAQFNTPAS